MTNTDSQQTGTVQGVRSSGGEHLTFRLGDESYGLEVLKVQEIVGMLATTDVPNTPDYVRGVVNLRGKVIPVMDLRIKFGMPACEYTNRTCIIVVQIKGSASLTTIGLIVDEVSEVLDIPLDTIEPPPEFGVGINVDVLLGLGKIDGKVIMLLDVDRIFGNDSLDASLQED
jgi:purine-binding chemotaxis protein CheW